MLWLPGLVLFRVLLTRRILADECTDGTSNRGGRLLNIFGEEGEGNQMRAEVWTWKRASGGLGPSRQLDLLAVSAIVSGSAKVEPTPTSWQTSDHRPVVGGLEWASASVFVQHRGYSSRGWMPEDAESLTELRDQMQTTSDRDTISCLSFSPTFPSDLLSIHVRIRQAMMGAPHVTSGLQQFRERAARHRELVEARTTYIRTPPGPARSENRRRWKSVQQKHRRPRQS